MALLTLANLGLSIGPRRLLDDVSLTLSAGERVGMVGRNGCGKSTLLKLIAGQTDLQLDHGEVQVSKGVRVGYLTQDPDLDHNVTVLEEATRAFAHLHALQERLEAISHEMAGSLSEDQLKPLLNEYDEIDRKLHSAKAFALDHRVETALHGVGLGDSFFGVRVGDLSGGQKGRLALAKLLLSEPDVLLLDEPTNHLDIAGRQWLEGFLAEFAGAAIIVSHDRWLLDHSVGRICELHNAKLEEYPGNYGQYVEIRAERRLAQERSFQKQQTRIAGEQAFIDRYRAGQRARQAQGRLKRLERFVQGPLITKPGEMAAMGLALKPSRRSGDMVLATDGLSKGYESKPLFSGLSMVVRRGERLGVIGPNGAGKSTLVNCILGELAADKGKTRMGSGVSVGYYRQNHDSLNAKNSVIDHLRAIMMRLGPAPEQSVRDLAGAFLFAGEDQDKKLGVMSGGERARATLAGLVIGGHNLLVLDEPTNHLDIPSAERLEYALEQFCEDDNGGTLILITHDRMLLENMADQLLILDGQGHVRHFVGRYSEYVASLSAAAARPAKAPPPKAKAAPAAAAKPGKGRTPMWFLTQEKLEAQIIGCEERMAEIDRSLANPAVYRDTAKVRRLQDERARLKGDLEPLETEWALRAKLAEEPQKVDPPKRGR